MVNYLFYFILFIHVNLFNYKHLNYLTDSDGTAFEARDLENDYGIVTNTRRPITTSPRGMNIFNYKNILSLLC